MTAADRQAHVEHALDFCWTLWTQLGVRGWEPRDFDASVDPEPLIIFTAELSLRDLRLRDEAIAWCIEHGRYISGVRLRNLLKIADDLQAAAYADFAAIVNANSTLNWPGASARRPRYEPRLRYEQANFQSRAALVVRMRAFMGVGARPELLKLFLAYPADAFSAPEASLHIFYGRRNVADALEALEAAGILNSVSDRNSRRFLPRDPTAIRKLFEPLPYRHPFWPDVFEVVIKLIRLLDKAPRQSPLTRVVDAQRFLEEQALTLARNYFVQPPSISRGKETWSLFEEWAARFMESLTASESPLLATPALRAMTAMPLHTRAGKKLRRSVKK